MAHSCPKCGATLEAQVRGRSDKWKVCEYCGFELDVPDSALGELFASFGEGATTTRKVVRRQVESSDGGVSSMETTYSISSEIPVEEFTIDFDSADTVEDAVDQVRREFGDEIARQIEPLLHDSVPKPMILDIDGSPPPRIDTGGPSHTTSHVVGSRPAAPAHHDTAGLKKILVVIAALLTLILLVLLSR